MKRGMAEPKYLRSILEKKNHCRRPPDPAFDTSLEPCPTKRREEWSISMETWDSPSTSSGTSSAMPKKQLYSAVIPGARLVYFRIMASGVVEEMKIGKFQGNLDILE